MEDEPYRKLVAAAIAYVSYKMRTEREIRTYLQKKYTRRFPDAAPAVEPAIMRLKELGYIDDAAYADRWVTERMRNKPKGPLVLLRELLVKGIDRDTAERAVNTARSGQDDAGVRAISGKAKTWSKLPELVFRKKAYNFLMRRGFSPETVSGIIDELASKFYNTGYGSG